MTVEYGVESVRDATLRAVNRGHDFAAARRAICLTAQRGIRTGAHFILGLPGEDDDMLIGQTAIINELPVHAVKFHQLQLLRGTPLSRRYDADPEAFGLRSPDPVSYTHLQQHRKRSFPRRPLRRADPVVPCGGMPPRRSRRDARHRLRAVGARVLSVRPVPSGDGRCGTSSGIAHAGDYERRRHGLRGGDGPHAAPFYL